MLDKKAKSTMMVKVKFIKNSAKLDVTNISSETMINYLYVRLGVFNFKSIEYYKAKHDVSYQNLRRYYRIEYAELLLEELNNFVKTLKREIK